MPKFVKKSAPKEPARKRLVVEEMAAPVIVDPAPDVAVTPVAAAVVEPEPTPVVETPVAPSVPVAEPAKMEEVNRVPDETVTSEMQVEEKKGMPKGLAFFLGLVIGGALGVGIVLGWGMFGGKLMGKVSYAVNHDEVVPTEAPEAMAEASPTPEAVAVKRSEVKVRIENGSGVAGAAAKASDFLKNLGYDVVSVGNSTETGLAETKVAVGVDKSAIGQMLLKDLGEKYSVATAPSSLVGSEEFDALVTVGK